MHRKCIYLQTTLAPELQKSNKEIVFGILKEDKNEIMLGHTKILATLLRSKKVQVRLHQNLATPLLTK